MLNRAADNLPPPARLPLWETPRCPHCGSTRLLLEQVGILAFVLRRDHCHACGAPLSLRLPILELFTAALFGWLAGREPFSLYLILLSFFTAILLLIAVIDLEHKLILNVLCLPATVLALLASPIILAGQAVPPEQLQLSLIGVSLLGAASGYLITLGIYGLGALFVRLVNRRSKERVNTVAFGMGDVKLAGLLGALIGFPAIFYGLVYAVLLGGVGALVVLVWRMARRQGYSAFMAIPYGPFLIAAGWAFLVWNPELLNWILG